MTMRLDELLQTILQSEVNDWNEISCWGSFSGPSYKDKLEFYYAYEGESNILHVDSHDVVAAYKKNLSITMAYGLTSNDDFIEKWANQFPNPKASSHFVDIFFNNALVFRETYLVVDGGRCKLPIPSFGENGALVVTKGYYEFVRFLQRLTYGTESNETFDRYFSQTETNILNTPWII